ncbi:hypothetical protein WOLCODRAFT_21663 [Wolfiporia cocos MD-104 SS10]|uniref:Uncharacterized protein n=1 Tax=Wolfiporia cocos (strain MD-104) TaxID=742152 RepID=A0A2H3JAL9_WOLCO|nr:hypothetical protein WOLCODRAFT_21663 [Wolfiporia cocos MD-104 SS10]
MSDSADGCEKVCAGPEGSSNMRRTSSVEVDADGFIEGGFAEEEGTKEERFESTVGRACAAAPRESTGTLS